MTFFAISLEEEKKKPKKEIAKRRRAIIFMGWKERFLTYFCLACVKISKSSDIWHWRDEYREFWRLKEAIFQMSRIVSQIRGC